MSPGGAQPRSWPDWMDEVQASARSITVDELTRFQPPPDHTGRRAAVLMLFSQGEQGGELLLTERAHHMRSHPGQVSFPGGTLDPGESYVEAALREAEEEIGLDPASVEVFGELPDLWVPPSEMAVRPILGWSPDPTEVSIRSADEVHAIHRVTFAELLDPANRITVTHPFGWRGPGFLLGPERDVVLWGFTGGIITRLFDHLGWTVPWDESRQRKLPAHMLPRREIVRALRNRMTPNTRLLDIEDAAYEQESDEK